MDKWTLFIVLFICISYSTAKQVHDEKKQMETFKIEGNITVPCVKPADWVGSAKVLVDGGRFVGFVRSDGTFEVNDIPTGSYVIEVAHPKYTFNSTRVDISARGKIRARKVDNIDPKSKDLVDYPLKVESTGLAEYFQKREEFRVMDALKNPAVLMMVTTVVFGALCTVLFKLNPELRSPEMQNMMNQRQDLPDLSEMATNLFGGVSSAQKKPKNKAKAKRK